MLSSILARYYISSLHASANTIAAWITIFFCFYAISLISHYIVDDHHYHYFRYNAIAKLAIELYFSFCIYWLLRIAAYM